VRGGDDRRGLGGGEVGSGTFPAVGDISGDADADGTCATAGDAVGGTDGAAADVAAGDGAAAACSPPIAVLLCDARRGGDWIPEDGIGRCG
jgi:hypothetical protein